MRLLRHTVERALSLTMCMAPVRVDISLRRRIHFHGFGVARQGPWCTVDKELRQHRQSSFLFRYLQDFYKWRDPDSNRGHHDFQSYAEAHRYAENLRRYADFCPRSTGRYQLVLSLLLRYC